MNEMLAHCSTAHQRFSWVKNADVIAFDYDNTIAATFEKSPDDMNVERASRVAIHAMFNDFGIGCIDRQGGVQNRSPREVIEAMLTVQDRRMLCDIARTRTRPYLNELSDVVMRGKGVNLDFDTHNQAELLTELFVRFKLRALLPSISQEWPRAFPSVLDFIETLRNKGTRVGIVTAGHDAFVQKTFDVWGVPCPDMISDDDMRALKDIAPDQKVKPSPLPYFALLERMGITHDPQAVRGYFGDDDMRDGGLARNAGLYFGLFDRTVTNKASYAFSDWGKLMPYVS